jgi:phage-related protein
MGALKPISFLGGSRDDLRGFPADARRQAGYQLDRLQRGLDPDDWRPMPSIGPRVREIRVRERAGAFRVIYVVSLVDLRSARVSKENAANAEAGFRVGGISVA